MRFECNTLETRPGCSVCLSVHGQNRLHTSLPWASLSYTENQEDTIVSVATLPLSGFQQKKANGGGSRSGRNGRAESFRAERWKHEREA